MAENSNVSYSLDQIVGLLTQQMQLLRGMQEKQGTGGASFFGTSMGNPFHAGSGQNPFSMGFANATGSTGDAGGRGMFGSSMLGRLGTGLGATMLERRIIKMNDEMASGMVSGFGFFQNKSKISNMDRMYAAANLGDKISSGILNTSSILLNAFGGTPGMIAGYGFQVMADQTRQQNAYNKYLLRNSNRFINYGESNNSRGFGGFNQSERMEAATYLRKFGTENLISDSDTQRLLQQFTEGDLLRNTRDLKSFKENMTKLTKAVKEGALMLGETYESMTNLMTDMKKLGMDPTKAASYTAGAAAIQGLTGLNGVSARSGLLSFAGSQAQGTGVSAGNLYENYTQKLLYTNAMYDDLYEKAQEGNQTAQRMHNLIVNNGGTEGAYQAVASAEQQILASNGGLASTIGVLYHDYNAQSGTWEFNQGKFNDVMNGDQSRLVEQAQQKLQASGAVAANSWLNQGVEYMMNLDSAQQSQAMKSYLNYLQNTKSQFRGQDLNTTQQLQLLLGMTGSQAELYAQTVDYMNADGGNLLKQYNALKTSQEALAKVNASQKGIGYSIKNFASGIADEMMPGWLVNASNSVATGWTNWTKGYQYTVTDASSKHGADTWEKSIEKVTKALDELSESAQKAGSSLGISKAQIDGLKGAVSSNGSTGMNVSSNFVSADGLYSSYKSATKASAAENIFGGALGGAGVGAAIGGIVMLGLSLATAPLTGGASLLALLPGIVADVGAGAALGAKIGAGAGTAYGAVNAGYNGTITEEEREDYLLNLRSFLGSSADETKYEVIMSGADKAAEYAQKLKSGGTAAEKSNWAQYLTSYNAFYGDFLDKDTRDIAQGSSRYIKQKQSPGSGASGMTKKEIDKAIKKSKDRIKDLEVDLATAKSSGGYVNGRSVSDIMKEISEEEKNISNFEIVRDETKTSQNQLNVASRQLSDVFGVTDDTLKEAGFIVEGKKIGKLDYDDVMSNVQKAENLFGQRAISAFNQSNGEFVNTKIGQKMASVLGVDAVKNITSAEDVQKAVNQMVEATMNSANAATDEKGNDKAEKYIDTITSSTDQLNDFKDALKDATSALNGFSPKVSNITTGRD